MRAEEVIHGPVAYSAGWLLVAGVLVVAVIAWNVGVWWWGRPGPDAGPTDREAAASPGPVDVAALRRAHLGMLDQIQDDVRAGRCDLRTAHQRLSIVGRAFLHAVSDVPASVLPLSELPREKVPALVEAVSLMYPSEFGRAPASASRADFDEAMRLVRQLVTTWT